MVKKALIALVLLLTTAAFAAPSPQVARVRAALASLPVPLTDRAGERAELRAQQLDEFAAAIADVSGKTKEPRVYAALLTTIGSSESNFDSQIVLGNCPAHRCDSHIVNGERVFRARGAFQVWETRDNRELWAVAHGNPRAQVAIADITLRRSLVRCKSFAPFPAHVFRAYRGGAEGSCSMPLRDEAARVALYLRMVVK